MDRRYSSYDNVRAPSSSGNQTSSGILSLDQVAALAEKAMKTVEASRGTPRDTDDTRTTGHQSGSAQGRSYDQRGDFGSDRYELQQQQGLQWNESRVNRQNLGNHMEAGAPSHLPSRGFEERKQHEREAPENRELNRPRGGGAPVGRGQTQQARRGRGSRDMSSNSKSGQTENFRPVRNQPSGDSPHQVARSNQSSTQATNRSKSEKPNPPPSGSQAADQSANENAHRPNSGPDQPKSNKTYIKKAESATPDAKKKQENEDSRQKAGETEKTLLTEQTGESSAKEHNISNKYKSNKKVVKQQIKKSEGDAVSDVVQSPQGKKSASEARKEKMEDKKPSNDSNQALQELASVAETAGAAEEKKRDEDTFCELCIMSFDCAKKYFHHTRGLLHTQRQMAEDERKQSSGTKSQQSHEPQEQTKPQPSGKQQKQSSQTQDQSPKVGKPSGPPQHFGTATQQQQSTQRGQQFQSREHNLSGQQGDYEKQFEDRHQYGRPQQHGRGRGHPQSLGRSQQSHEPQEQTKPQPSGKQQKQSSQTQDQNPKVGKPSGPPQHFGTVTQQQQSTQRGQQFQSREHNLSGQQGDYEKQFEDRHQYGRPQQHGRGRGHPQSLGRSQQSHEPQEQTKPQPSGKQQKQSSQTQDQNPKVGKPSGPPQHFGTATQQQQSTQRGQQFQSKDHNPSGQQGDYEKQFEDWQQYGRPQQHGRGRGHPQSFGRSNDRQQSFGAREMEEWSAYEGQQGQWENDYWAEGPQPSGKQQKQSSQTQDQSPKVGKPSGPPQHFGTATQQQQSTQRGQQFQSREHNPSAQQGDYEQFEDWQQYGRPQQHGRGRGHPQSFGRSNDRQQSFGAREMKEWSAYEGQQGQWENDYWAEGPQPSDKQQKQSSQTQDQSPKVVKPSEPPQHFETATQQQQQQSTQSGQQFQSKEHNLSGQQKDYEQFEDWQQYGRPQQHGRGRGHPQSFGRSNDRQQSFGARKMEEWSAYEGQQGQWENDYWEEGDYGQEQHFGKPAEGREDLGGRDDAQDATTVQRKPAAATSQGLALISGAGQAEEEDLEEEDDDDYEDENVKSEFHCELCDILTTGAVNLRAHLNGRNHRLVQESVDKGTPLPRRLAIKLGPNSKAAKKQNPTASAKSKPGEGPSVLLALLKNIPEAIVGLKCVKELELGNQITFVCIVCDTQCNPSNVQSHLMGVKHRMNYLMEHHPVAYDHVKTHGGKKSQLSAFLEEVCSDIESKEGRGKPILGQPEENPKNADEKAPKEKEGEEKSGEEKKELGEGSKSKDQSVRGLPHDVVMGRYKEEKRRKGMMEQNPKPFEPDFEPGRNYRDMFPKQDRDFMDRGPDRGMPYPPLRDFPGPRPFVTEEERHRRMCEFERHWFFNLDLGLHPGEARDRMLMEYERIGIPYELACERICLQEDRRNQLIELLNDGEPLEVAKQKVITIENRRQLIREYEQQGLTPREARNRVIVEEERNSLFEDYERRGFTPEEARARIMAGQDRMRLIHEYERRGMLPEEAMHKAITEEDRFRRFEDSLKSGLGERGRGSKADDVLDDIAEKRMLQNFMEQGLSRDEAENKVIAVLRQQGVPTQEATLRMQKIKQQDRDRQSASSDHGQRSSSRGKDSEDRNKAHSPEPSEVGTITPEEARERLLREYEKRGVPREEARKALINELIRSGVSPEEAQRRFSESKRYGDSPQRGRESERRGRQEEQYTDYDRSRSRSQSRSWSRSRSRSSSPRRPPSPDYKYSSRGTPPFQDERTCQPPYLDGRDGRRNDQEQDERAKKQKEELREHPTLALREELRLKKKRSGYPEDAEVASKRPKETSSSQAGSSKEGSKLEVTNLLDTMTKNMISSEDDAAMALQVSKALTSALLKYRLKSVKDDKGEGSEQSRSSFVERRIEDAKKLFESKTMPQETSQGFSGQPTKQQKQPSVRPESFGLPPPLPTGASWPQPSYPAATAVSPGQPWPPYPAAASVSPAQHQPKPSYPAVSPASAHTHGKVGKIFPVAKPYKVMVPRSISTKNHPPPGTSK